MKVTTFLFTSIIEFNFVTALPVLDSGDVVAPTKSVSLLSEPAVMDQNLSHIISKRATLAEMPKHDPLSPLPEHRPSDSSLNHAERDTDRNPGHPAYPQQSQDRGPSSSGFTPAEKAKWIGDPGTHMIKDPKVSNLAHLRPGPVQSESPDHTRLKWAGPPMKTVTLPNGDTDRAQPSGFRRTRRPYFRAVRTQSHYWKPALEQVIHAHAPKLEDVKPRPEDTMVINWTGNPNAADRRRHRDLRKPLDWTIHACRVLARVGCPPNTAANARLVVMGNGVRYADITNINPNYRGSTQGHAWPGGMFFRVPPQDAAGKKKELAWKKKNPDVDDPVYTP